MRLKTVVALAALALTQPAMATDTRFLNLTSATVRSLELAPVATGAFGPNLSNPGGAVDHGQQVTVAGVVTGVYVARLRFADGRTCLARNVQIEVGKAFAVEDRDLTDCGR